MVEILLVIMLKGLHLLCQMCWIWLWNFGTVNIGLKVTSVERTWNVEQLLRFVCLSV